MIRRRSVEALGPGVTSLAVGDHVVLSPCAPCGHCPWCIRGEWALCTNGDALITASHPDGGTRLSRNGEVVYRGLAVAAFAEHVIIQETGAVKIPEDVPLDVACVVGCAVQTGVGAVLNTAKVGEGDTVLVMGLGGVGLSVVQGARLAGASRIIVSDPVAARREQALAFGATDAIDPTTDDVVTACHDLTEHNIGVDFAFDAAGSSPYFHYRKVKWIGESIPRSHFGKDLLFSFGAFMTICRVQRNNAEARIAAMRANGWKAEALAALTQPESADVPDADTGIPDLEVLARDQIAQERGPRNFGQQDKW